jgi:beta-lactamase regulating signal transducer with metallopeptidase domain
MKSTIAELALALSQSVELSIVTKATVLMMFGLAAVGIARHARASIRHLLLATTFVMLLALPLTIVVGPSLAIEVPFAQGSHSAGVSSTNSSTDSLVQAVARSPEAGNIETSSWSMPPWQTLARWTWFAGLLLLTLPVAVDLWRLRRLIRNGLPSTRLSDLMRAVADECGLRRQTKVLLHEDLRAPLMCGIWRPVILLPPDADEWAESDLRRAFVHELEHAQRGDWATQLLARTVCSFYWFHPLVWMAWRRLRLEAERACDDAVVQSAEHTEYAEQLVSLSRQLSTLRTQSILGMANRSDLSRRVSALLDRNQRRGRAGVIAALSVMLIATAAVVSIAPLRAVAQSPSFSATTQTRKNDDSNPLDRALYDAAEEGNTAEINRLLDAGANVNCALEGDGSPLIGAARNGYIRAVALLLDRGADPNMPVRGDGNPIIMAAREGHADIVELLLNRGAHIDQVVPDDENALIQASGSGHLNVAKLLVGRGANIYARVKVERPGDRGSEWRTPLSMARKGGHSEVVAYLLSVGARE